jgi:serine/threonine-protein kinase
MSPQQTIAHYRITAKLGEGGMGAVYRATDTKLNRDVAIKILPPAFAEDAARMQRFEREAQLLASLNHPNIAAIYGIEQSAIIMELVEGADLAGPLPVATVIDYARQIAAALEAAHEKGIIHRDLKPANIKVTPEGVVKLLDFGLAKAREESTAASGAASPTMSPTLSLAMTQAGMILGTAAYMSPEQARGKPVDRRADIWAFGVILYELLTGRHLYGGGETVTDTLAAVVLKEPDFSRLPTDTPKRLRRLIERCLRKDPKMRLRDIGDARLALDEPEEVVQISDLPRPEPPAPVRRGAPWWSLAAAVALLLLLGLSLFRATRPVDRPMIRVSADLGPDAASVGSSGVVGNTYGAIISPDGARIVFPVSSHGVSQLATRLMDQSQPTLLPGTEGARYPFFKPDSQWIGFSAGGKMKKISVQGGAAVAFCDTGSGDRGASWGEDGTIIATLDANHLFRIPEAGGTPQMLPVKSSSKEQVAYRWPQILPGGETILATAGTVGGFENGDIVAISLKTGDLNVVAHGGHFGRYLPTGHLLYLHQGTLFAVPFDPKRLEMRGASTPVQDEVVGNTTTGYAALDFSRTGTLVYLSGKSAGEQRTIVWMDATGKKTPLITPQGVVLAPRLAPDGKRLAFSANGDIHVFDPQRGATTKITFEATTNSFPVWTPDGKHIVYTRANTSIWWTRADGSAQPVRLLENASGIASWSFSPDGRRLAFTQSGGGTQSDIWVLPLDTADPDHPAPGKPELFVQTPQPDSAPAFSPDGRWIAYMSIESHTPQVYVRPYPPNPSAGKWQVSISPSGFPVWSRTAKQIFYESSPDGHIFVADYTVSGDTFSPGKPRPWSDRPIVTTGAYPNLDLAPDAKRFVVFPTSDAAAGGTANVHVTFLFNFFDELRRKLP